MKTVIPTPNFCYIWRGAAMTRQDDISGLLMAWSKGDESALGDVMPLVYRDLRGIARNQLRRRGARLVMQSGTLAHEAYLRLVHTHGIRCGSRAHFFALCSQMIRRILVDEARKQHYAKRGGGQVQVSLQEALLGDRAAGVDVEALNDALTSLAKQDARKARVVELRFFGGLSVEETAEVLEISEETVTRDWRMAKTWLLRELGGGKSGG
ncbi:MAG: sigma-70 family RNA polymerase sigma factor [Bryobacterales bacterium]|nr:sigma-70 family RNA polymerase sigma factor [Bryobacterales bacterium]